MNFKLIEKLARLANNNPNENEANLAARKVCKLLAKSNFKFVEDSKVPPPKQETPKRSSEPFWKTHYYDEGPMGFDWEGWAGKWTYQGQTRSYDQESPSWEERTKEKKEWNPVDDWILNPQTRVYKNRVTNVEITEIEFVNRYGMHIKF